MAMLNIFVKFSLLLGALSLDLTAPNLMDECQQACEPKETMVPCQRGCRFYGIQEKIEGVLSSPALFLDHCKQDCKEAYGDEHEQQCFGGCERQHGIREGQRALENTEEEGGFWLGPVARVQETFVRTMGGMQVMSSRLLAFFVRGNETMVVVGPQRTFVMEGPAGETAVDDTGVHPESEAASGEAQDFDDMLRSLENRLEGGATGPTVQRLSRRRLELTALAINVTAVLATIAVFVFALSMLVRVQRRRAQGLKQANLTVAIQQEPLKLVRPEDLTKLSLIEDDTLDLPNARV